MNKRVIWLAVAVGLILAGYFVNRWLGPPQPTESYALPRVPAWPSRSPYEPPPLPPPTIPPMFAPAPLVVLPAAWSPPPMTFPMPLEIPIQDGATIDFSIGSPVVRSGGEDTEALDRALREMAEATKKVTFPPARGEPEPGR